MTLAELAARLWAGKFQIIVGAVLGLAVAVLYLDRTTFLYTASMKVTSAQSPQSSGSVRSGMSGLAALAGVSLGGSNGASPFDIYLETLTSENVARRLADDPTIMRTVFASDWDAARNQWRQPEQSTLGQITRSLKEALGIPVRIWRKPDARELAGFIHTRVAIQRDTRSPVVGITLDYPKPEFAVRLLTRINRETDQLIRENALIRSQSYVDYLERKLPTVTVAEQREALIQTLSEQEKSIMMASSAVPFAATVISGPVVSELPTKPNASTIVAAFICVGIILGAAIVLMGGKMFTSSE